MQYSRHKFNTEIFSVSNETSSSKMENAFSSQHKHRAATQKRLQNKCKRNLALDIHHTNGNRMSKSHIAWALVPLKLILYYWISSPLWSVFSLTRSDHFVFDIAQDGEPNCYFSTNSILPTRSSARAMDPMFFLHLCWRPIEYKHSWSSNSVIKYIYEKKIKSWYGDRTPTARTSNLLYI